jgi:hypothetical protein
LRRLLEAWQGDSLHVAYFHEIATRLQRAKQRALILNRYYKLLTARAQLHALGPAHSILQDSSGTASFNIFDDAGNVLQRSSTHFVFPFPLIETTADPVHKQIYVIGYPKGVDGAALHVFDGELNLLSSDVSESVQYFYIQP